LGKITVGQLLHEICGGPRPGRQFKALIPGGSSSKVLRFGERFQFKRKDGTAVDWGVEDIPLDFDSFALCDTMGGSGGMIVMDDSSCIVDVAKYFMEFCQSESCGKCVPCRVGTTHLYRLLERVTTGEAEERELRMLEELCDVVRRTSLCGLGQSAPNPILSTLRYFRDEYDAHVGEKRCPAGVCKIHAQELNA
jgi:NADH:ubiquinone oxidoreductase subunit F (NADH-binding)